VSSGAQSPAELRLVEAVGSVVGRRPIVLVGSRAIGTSSDGSDYDVLVVLPTSRIPGALGRLRPLAEMLSREFGAGVSLNPIPESVLRHGRSLYAWKVRREGRVLSAPNGFDLGRDDEPIQLTAEKEFSYLASAAMYLLEAVPTTPPGSRPNVAPHGTRKAMLHLAQLRLLRRGAYAQSLESALIDLDDRKLSALVSADPTEQLLRVRDEIVRELHCLPSASRRRALSTNLRYAVLARLRGRNRMRCILFRRPVDHLLADAMCELLHEIRRDGLKRLGSATSAGEPLRSVVGKGLRPDWFAARDVILREWPDAHPLAAQ
jgi:predicted nucleotidyltransferase